MTSDRHSAAHEAAHAYMLHACPALRQAFNPAGAALTRDGGGFVHQAGLDVDRAIEAPNWTAPRNGIFEAVFLSSCPEHIEDLFRFNFAGFAFNLSAGPHTVGDRVRATTSSDGEDVLKALQWLSGLPTDSATADQFLRATRSDILRRAEAYFDTHPEACAAVERLATELQKHRRMAWAEIESLLSGVALEPPAGASGIPDPCRHRESLAGSIGDQQQDAARPAADE